MPPKRKENRSGVAWILVNETGPVEEREEDKYYDPKTGSWYRFDREVVYFGWYDGSENHEDGPPHKQLESQAREMKYNFDQEMVKKEAAALEKNETFSEEHSTALKKRARSAAFAKYALLVGACLFLAGMKWFGAGMKWFGAGISILGSIVGVGAIPEPVKRRVRVPTVPPDYFEIMCGGGAEWSNGRMLINGRSGWSNLGDLKSSVNFRAKRPLKLKIDPSAVLEKTRNFTSPYERSQFVPFVLDKVGDAISLAWPVSRSRNPPRKATKAVVKGLTSRDYKDIEYVRDRLQCMAQDFVDYVDSDDNTEEKPPEFYEDKAQWLRDRRQRMSFMDSC